jgi:hypothetical protein
MHHAVVCLTFTAVLRSPIAAPPLPLKTLFIPFIMKFKMNRKQWRVQCLQTTAATSASSASAADVFHNDESGDAASQESDSEEDTDEEFSCEQDAAPNHINIHGIIQTAQHERVMASTRYKYAGHLRQMACWAQSADQFKHFVDNGEMKMPLDPDCMIGYTQYLKNHMVLWRHHEVPGTMKHLAVKSVSGFFAAAKDSYAFHGKAFPESVLVYFSNFIRGYSLFIAVQKDKHLHPDRTNSIGFSVSVYEQICRKGIEYIQDRRGSCYSAWHHVWLFWLFLYNLLGRATQVSRILYDWIWWQDDAMVVKVPTQKGDQNGNLSYWKRVYANPLKPWMCPVLALAIHVFSITPADSYNNRVFTGNGQAFTKRFKIFMSWGFPAETLEGIPKHRITSHSPKRSGICLVNGNEVVKWDAAELRADHKVGLTSIYQTCAAPQQDGIMGRLLAGLEFATADFNVAPHHFKKEDADKIQFKDFVAHYSWYGPAFRTVIPFLLASVVAHLYSGQLSKMLPKGHPFWSSTLILRHQIVLSQLQLKIQGGRIGAPSLLPLTGNSVTSDTRVDVAEIKADVKALRSQIARGGSAALGNHSFSDVGTSQIHDQLNCIQEDMRCVKQKLEREYDIVAAAAGAQAIMPRRCVPVFYLSNAFKLSSVSPFNLLTRWLTPEPPAPAWRHIRNEMLPRIEGRRAQENLLSTYRKFMDAFIGCRPNYSDVESNITSFFDLAWARMARVCEWDSTRSPTRATKTVYGWLLEQPTKIKLLQDSKVVVSVTVQTEEVRNSHLLHEVHAAVAGEAQDLSSLIVLNEPAPAACVPRNALLYPANGPRPLPQLRKGEQRRREHDEYDAYVAAWAPKPGAKPCWPCPFCITARHFHCTVNLYRHIRDAHDDRGEDHNEGAKLRAISDIACLVWCCNRGGASYWEPVLQ